MNWKRYLIVFINVLFISFSYNILGCGEEIDSHDYFTSFFQNNMSPKTAWHPLYYTNYAFSHN